MMLFILFRFDMPRCRHAADELKMPIFDIYYRPPLLLKRADVSPLPLLFTPCFCCRFFATDTLRYYYDIVIFRRFFFFSLDAPLRACFAFILTCLMLLLHTDAAAVIQYTHHRHAGFRMPPPGAPRRLPFYSLMPCAR